MTTKFSTCSKSVSNHLWFKPNYCERSKRYNYSVSDFKSNSMSDYNSHPDSDSSSASMNLVTFVFFILYLHSSK